MPASSEKFRAFVWDEAKKWMVRWAFVLLAAMLVALFTPWWQQAVAVWLSPGEIREANDRLDRIERALARITGEDRIIRVDRSQTYVIEPVHRGEIIQLNIVASRTTAGAGCQLLSRTPIFVDQGGVAMAGARVVPARQLGEVPERLILMFEAPAQLSPGRVTLSLSLEFTCNGGAIFETTDPVAFRLLA